MPCLFCKNPKCMWADNVWIYGKPLELCHSCYAFYTYGNKISKDKFFECSLCGKLVLKDFSKSWATTCFDCWKIGKNKGNVPFIVLKEELEKIRKDKEEKAKLFAMFRSLRPNSKELIKQKIEFLGKLESLEPNPLDIITFEMYPLEIGGETIKSKKIECPLYSSECKWHNTRVRIKTETRAEVDNLPYEQAFQVISEICLALINKGYSFSVFYAEGQKSPHVIIYDFEEMRDLDPFMREQVQKNFWRELTPLWKHLDKAVWEDEHFVPLEYAPHWKYGTPFNLLFEYKVEEECKN